jgi:predicted Zn finger-like uncharacterized protein
MNVSCPQCHHDYKLDESRIPDNGQRMRCPKCSCTFRVFRDGRLGDATSMPPGAAATLPSRPSVAPKRPQRGPRRPEPGESSSSVTSKGIDADLPAPKGTDSFFDLDLDADLPTPVAAADLPAPKAKQKDPFGGVDLPTPAFAADLPAPKAKQKDPFGIVDLPTPAFAADLPAPKVAAAFAGDIPSPDRDDPFGDIDLPTPSRNVDLPTPKHDDPFGGLDLPTPSRNVDLPTPKHDDPFGDLDLPTPSKNVDLPTPKHDDPFGEIDLPTPSSAEFLPAPKEHDAFGAPPPPVIPPASGGRERVQSSGSTDFGEIDLGEAPDKGRATNEFDGFPTAEDSGPKPAEFDVGRDSGFDLAESPRAHAKPGTIIDTAPTESAKDKKGGKFEGRRRFERQSRRLRSTLLLLLALFIAGGGALYFTDFGPFGAYLIAEILPNAGEEKAVRQVVAKIERRLQDDTFAGLNDALVELDATLKEYPDNEDLTLYGVFLHNWHDVRFGDSEQHIRAATKLLGRIDLEKSDSRYARLAKASGDVSALRTDAAIKSLSAGPKPEPDELALLVVTHLAADDGRKALAGAQRLAAAEKSPRAEFLRGVALLRSGDRAGGIEALEKLVDEHSRHAGARLELAAALLEHERRNSTRAETLLLPVVESKESGPHEKARAHALIGRAHFRNRQFQKAGDAFQAAAALHADDVDLLVGKGFLALSQDDVASAVTLFVKARAEDSTYLAAKLGHAEAMYRKDLFGDAKSLVADVLQEAPGDPYAHYLMGRIAMALKSFEEAEKELNAAVAADEELVDGYVALSDLYTKTGRDQEAMQILDTAGEKAPGSALIKLTLADAYAARGDFATAIVALNDALAAEPDNTRTHFRMAQMYRRLGSVVDAESALGEVISRNPSYPGLALEQGLLLEATGKLAEALAAYERALKDTPDDPAAKLRVGAASLALADFAKAEPLLAEAAAAMPKLGEANYYMGEILRRTDREGEAIPYLRAAADLEEKNALFHLRLGMALMAMHDMTRAMVEAERAQTLDPNLAEAPLRIGEIKLRTGSARDAIALFEAALAKDPKLSEAYGLIGEACEELADFGAALRYYQRAVQELPDDATLNFKLGVTALQTTGPRTALAPLAKAVALADKPGADLPAWLPEAYYRLGVLQQSSNQRPAALASFKRYLEIAPEKAIDRTEVQTRLEQLGAAE